MKPHSVHFGSIETSSSGQSGIMRESACESVLVPAVPSTAAVALAREARFSAIASEHHDAVWRALRQLGLSPESVDDGVQEVLLVALRRLDEIRVGGERAYLLGIALRVASHARRAMGRRREDGPVDADFPASSSAPDELADRQRALSRLEEALHEMPRENREAFVLFDLEELTAPEVAELLGVPVGTVASRVKRARELVRQKVLGRGGVK